MDRYVSHATVTPWKSATSSPSVLLPTRPAGIAGVPSRPGARDILLGDTLHTPIVFVVRVGSPLHSYVPKRASFSSVGIETMPEFVAHNEPVACNVEHERVFQTEEWTLNQPWDHPHCVEGPSIERIYVRQPVRVSSWKLGSIHTLADQRQDTLSSVLEQIQLVRECRCAYVHTRIRLPFRIEANIDLKMSDLVHDGSACRRIKPRSATEHCLEHRIHQLFKHVRDVLLVGEGPVAVDPQVSDEVNELQKCRFFTCPAPHIFGSQR